MNISKLAGRALLLFSFSVFCGIQLHAADMPEGEGKDLLEANCTGCHDLGRVANQKKTKSDWIDTVSRMVDKGASLDSKQFDTVIAYLVKNFGKEDSNIHNIAAKQK